ncbi:MAG: VCBS repeat-containing protein, partial [Acidobacteriota bacterium]
MQQATSRLRARGAAIATFGLTLLAPLAAHAGEIPTAQDVENVDPFFRGAREVRALDWDRDGRLDVVGIGIVEGSASYWRNGEFGWIENGLAGFGPYTSLDIGDLNGDGTTDVVYTIGDSAATNDRVGGYLNRPGILGFPIALGDEVDHPISVRLGDFDDDGDLDAVSLEFGSREINLHENAGDGVTWTTSTISTLANRPSDAVVHDVDLDGDLDVVIITGSDLVWL